MKTSDYKSSLSVKEGYCKLSTYELTSDPMSGSWISCLLKRNYTKSVHVLKDWRTGKLTASMSFGSIIGSAYYALDNCPDFIKNHIDFSKIVDTESIEFRTYGLRFRNKELI